MIKKLVYQKLPVDLDILIFLFMSHNGVLSFSKGDASYYVQV